MRLLLALSAVIALGYASRCAAESLADELRIADLKATAAGISFSFPTASNRSYAVHYGPMNPPFWWTLTNVVGNGQPAKIYDRFPPAGSRFYKVFANAPLAFVTLGAVTPTSARIAVGLDKSRDLRIAISTNATLASPTVQGPYTVNPADDFTRAIDLADLSPNTRYYYSLIVDGDTQYAAPYPSVTTAVEEGSGVNVRFAFGSCFKASLAGGNATLSFRAPVHANTVCDSILAKDPRFLLHLGDTVYCDHSGALDLPSFRQIHRHSVDERLPNMAAYGQLRRNVPFYTTWDDHEIINDWPWDSNSAAPWSSGYLAPARKSFQEYYGRGNPDPIVPGQLYYSFTFGNIGFFVIDGRSFRSAQQAEDYTQDALSGAITAAFSGNLAIASNIGWNSNQGFTSNMVGRTIRFSNGTARHVVGWLSATTIRLSEPVSGLPATFVVEGKTLLGRQQKEHLKTWLLQTKDSLRVRFIATSTPINGLTEHITRRDAWGAGYQSELNEILDFIVANSIRNVVFLTGDQHWSGSFNRRRGAHNFFEFMASPFSAFLFGKYNGTDPELLSRVLWMWDGAAQGMNEAFGTVTVRTDANPATVKFELFDLNGTLLNSSTLFEGPAGLEILNPARP